MNLRKTSLLMVLGLIFIGFSESPEEVKTLVPKNVVIPTLLNYLMRQGITVKVPRYMEEDFVVVFDNLPDLRPGDRRLINNLKFKKAQLRNIVIKVKLDDLVPVNSGREQAKQHFLLNSKNDLRCKIKSFKMKADLKITRKGRDIFGNKLPPVKAVIDKFELKDIDSMFRFYLVKSKNEYYAEKLALRQMVLSPKASIKIREFSPMVNKIISDIMGPVIADIGNKEILNDAFYKEFNANLPLRIPESGPPNLPGIIQEILR